MAERMTVARVMALAPNATSVETTESFLAPPGHRTCILHGPVTDAEVAEVQRVLDLTMIGEVWTVRRESAD